MRHDPRDRLLRAWTILMLLAGAAVARLVLLLVEPA
jgi:hypothetical protein